MLRNEYINFHAHNYHTHAPPAFFVCVVNEAEHEAVRIGGVFLPLGRTKCISDGLCLQCISFFVFDVLFHKIFLEMYVPLEPTDTRGMDTTVASSVRFIMSTALLHTHTIHSLKYAHTFQRVRAGEIDRKRERERAREARVHR